MKKYVGLLTSIALGTLAALSACSSSSSGGTAGIAQDSGPGTDAPTSTTDDGGSDGGMSIEPMKWTWVPIPGAKCRDGSDTGVAVNLNPASTKLMIFMEGGGACFNSITCGGNPSKYGAAEFAQYSAPATGFNGTFDKGGTNTILTRADDKNPVKDWNMMYVPYCTGDVHGGANPAGMAPGVSGTQMYVGYNNVKLDLDYIKQQVPNTTDVLLAGMSGGGFGVLVNYDQVADAFGSVPVTMLDDSGPPMEDPYLAHCLQSQVSTLWGLDKTVLAACGADCQGDGGLDTANFGIDVLKHLGKKYPNRALGLVDATGDVTIRSFFAFGVNDCTGSPLSNTPPDATFTAGLVDIRSQMTFDPKFGVFIFTSEDHTSIEGQLDTRTGGGDDGGGPLVNLNDWISQLLQGNVTQVGP